MILKPLKVVLSVFLLTAAILACEFQAGPFPDSPNVETVVAQTMQALTPGRASPGTAPAPAPQDGLLPHTLYFRNNDNTGLLQVYRLETDGATLRQGTFEPSNVETYDVSPGDNTSFISLNYGYLFYS